ncbi:glycoside hydrolase family 73 protein [Lactiplantibacillus sp. WILCCON 0030]|uniref:Glycoside hydrolase family 73 protein n=1 Tax=Lactiplantibacillus brownii TaxID=3069269 RepID=A0ABU1A7K2_9LACO|nr:glycoside hydrolase family 73 protein [Lactiplantibacillus brownii]MDQ7936911.1 glycoside hydrolase family 73 protein [Lactiplantibacillus brownii]
MAKKRRASQSNGILIKNQQIQWVNLLIVIIVIGGLGMAIRSKFVADVPATAVQTKRAKPTVLSHPAFIKKLAPDAQQMQTKYHVLASISLSQAILESNWGRSANARQNNNLFGVKATGQEKGKLMATKEFHDGAYHQEKQRFRVYDSWHASMVGHARKLAYGTPWDSKHYQAVIQATDYQTAAVALVNAGYATDPAYAQKLINIIQKYDLQRYDKK